MKFDSYSTSNLLELDGIIKEIKSNYDTLSNYNKVIKLFEIYRMMKELRRKMYEDKVQHVTMSQAEFFAVYQTICWMMQIKQITDAQD